MLFVDSSPSNAAVTINGKLEEDRTESKFALAGGRYDLTISRTGYVDWKKSITVEGGRVRFVTYPLLLPLVISPQSIKEHTSSIGFQTQSPDRKWLVVQPLATVPSIDIYDLEDENRTSTSFVLPTTALVSIDGNFGTLKVVEWSTDNRHFLLSQDAPDGKRYFIVVDRTNADATVNLNQVFSTDPTQVVLFDKKFDRYYFYYASDGSVRRANLSTRTVDAPLLEQVLAFKSYSDSLISFATPKDAEADKYP